MVWTRLLFWFDVTRLRALRASVTLGWREVCVPFRGNFELHPLGVAMGNAVSVTRVWSIHIKTPLVGRQQPMTSLLSREPQYKGALGKYVILFFVVTMASTSKAFKRCVHPCHKRYLTPDDTHDLCSLLFGRGARTQCSRGSNLRALWVFSLWESSALVCLSFRGRRGSRLLPAGQDPRLLRHGGDWTRGARRRSWLMS